MGDHIYKLVELTGTSSTTIEDAVKNAIERASKTVRNMRWLQIVETRGRIENEKITRWEVIIKVGFVLEDTL